MSSTLQTNKKSAHLTRTSKTLKRIVANLKLIQEFQNSIFQAKFLDHQRINVRAQLTQFKNNIIQSVQDLAFCQRLLQTQFVSYGKSPLE